MHYSFVEHQWSPDAVAKLQALMACDDIRLLTKKGGGNSLVFCVEAAGKKWAVKSYPPYAPGQRDRVAAELMVYQFLNEHHVPAVPFLKAYSETERWLVIDWIDGEIPQQYGAADVEQAIHFIRCIDELRDSAHTSALPPAAEACLSLTILLNQIQQRLQRLQSLPAEPLLNEFLTNQFIPAFEQYQRQAIDGYYVNKMHPEAELAQEKRSLIPADFGFHNTIRNAVGELYFFDFDYFGWDDPVKLLADILWHPKMQLSDSQKQQFIEGLADVYRRDPLFLSRFYYTWPLFGLRWVLILLNEFIPAFWQNRQHAETYKDQVQNQAEAKIMQLNRAKELLSHVQQIGCPYEVIAATSI